jgi:Mg-chelatase subunit ChlD
MRTLALSLLVLSACSGSKSPAGPTVACRGVALELLVDRSGSMSGAPSNWAKAAARDAVDKAADGDCIGVVAFDDTPTVTVPLAPLDRVAMRRAIDGIHVGGGTELLPALDVARSELPRASEPKRRHVLLLTDGQAASGDLPELARAMSAEGITLSTIGLGGGIDENLLRALSAQSGGRFYKIDDPAGLVPVFEQELELLHKR